MRKIAISLAALATVAIAFPVANSARAEERVVIKTGRHRHHDRGLHVGWDHSRHWGRRDRDINVGFVGPRHRHHDRTVIIKKRGYHHDLDD